MRKRIFCLTFIKKRRGSIKSKIIVCLFALQEKSSTGSKWQ